MEADRERGKNYSSRVFFFLFLFFFFLGNKDTSCKFRLFQILFPTLRVKFWRSVLQGFFFFMNVRIFILNTLLYLTFNTSLENFVVE